MSLKNHFQLFTILPLNGVEIINLNCLFIYLVDYTLTINRIYQQIEYELNEVMIRQNEIKKVGKMN